MIKVDLVWRRNRSLNVGREVEKNGWMIWREVVIWRKILDIVVDCPWGDHIINNIACVGSTVPIPMFSAINKSAENLKSACFALRSRIMITLSAEFFMLLNRVVFIRDAGGMKIVEILVEICESFRMIVMASLSVSKEEHVSAIPKLTLLRIRIATPSPCSLVLSLCAIVWFGISSLKLLLSTFHLE